MMLEHALRALELGPVFPCLPGTKRPATSNGFLDASSDETQIRAWWADTPDAAPAFVGGDTITIDVDSSREKNKFGDCELMELVRDHGPIPRTLQILTPSVGAHFHFRCPAGLTIRRQCRSLGSRWIDVLATGGYCMAPGGAYQIVDDSPVAELSGWLLEAVLASQAPVTPVSAPPRLDGRWGRDLEHRARRALAYVECMPPALSGSGGHEATFRVALAVVRGFELPADVALEVMRFYNGACKPMWSDAELRHKVADAERSNISSGYLLERGAA